MPKVRRFRVDSLQTARPGTIVNLAEDEAAHTRVLRLKSGTEVEVFDEIGRSAKGVLVAAPNACVQIDSVETPVNKKARMILGTAWPKLDVLIPVRYSRSVVSKDEEAEGLHRLRRIAVEAAKQCGRNEPLQIAPERSFQELVTQQASDHIRLLLDPRADESIAEVLMAQRDVLKSSELLLFVGPEGGFSAQEIDLAIQFQIRRVTLAKHVLRIETAAIAACAVTRALLD
jgi:16S rRNA (uracil1498-N3)-methyltransferase